MKIYPWNMWSYPLWSKNLRICFLFCSDSSFSSWLTKILEVQLSLTSDTWQYWGNQQAQRKREEKERKGREKEKRKRRGLSNKSPPYSFLRGKPGTGITLQPDKNTKKKRDKHMKSLFLRHQTLGSEKQWSLRDGGVGVGNKVSLYNLEVSSSWCNEGERSQGPEDFFHWGDRDEIRKNKVARVQRTKYQKVESCAWEFWRILKDCHKVFSRILIS